MAGIAQALESVNIAGSLAILGHNLVDHGHQPAGTGDARCLVGELLDAGEVVRGDAAGHQVERAGGKGQGQRVKLRVGEARQAKPPVMIAGGP